MENAPRANLSAATSGKHRLARCFRCRQRSAWSIGGQLDTWVAHNIPNHRL